MNFQPPIAKGIVHEFDEMLKNIHKLSIISHIYERHKELPLEYKQVLQSYNKITENSTEDDCCKMICLMKDFPSGEEYVSNIEMETAVEGFYRDFLKFRNLVEQKITLPLEEWKNTKWDLMHFSETYNNLQQQLDEVLHSVEKTRFQRRKERLELESEKEGERKLDSNTEDFISLQPFLIISNAEEHIDKISALKEKKLEALKDQLKLAEENLQRAIKANRKEIQTIIEEAIDTKSFIEWTEKKNYSSIKELEVNITEEWNEFSREMEMGRKLAATYAEKHAIYIDIKRQEDEKERLGKYEAAATVLQAHWRGYITRRRLRGETIF